MDAWGAVGGGGWVNYHQMNAIRGWGIRYFVKLPIVLRGNKKRR